LGAEAAQPAILQLEFQLAQQPGGFSFKNIAADRSGSRCGRTLKEKRLSLGTVAKMFDVSAFMPEVDKLQDNIAPKDLAAQYGTHTDPRFAKKLGEIDQQVMVLPGYRLTTSVFGR